MAAHRRRPEVFWGALSPNESNYRWVPIVSSRKGSSTCSAKIVPRAASDGIEYLAVTMPASLADFSAKIASRTGEPVLFAVTGDAPGGWGSMGAAPGAGALMIPFGLAGGLVGAMISGIAIKLSKWRHGRKSRYARVVIAFTETELIEYDWPMGCRSPKGVNVRLPLAEVTLRYRRTDLAVATRLDINGHEWTVHGWFERDLRAAIAGSVWAERLVPTTQLV